MYAGLLIMTPFIMLRHFLQDTIGMLSRLMIPLRDIQIPGVLVIAIAAVVALAVTYRRQITKLRVIAALTGLAMVWFAQQIADYYFSHEFYDLQHNWHYIAYGLFAFMVFRDLRPRGVPLSVILFRTAVFAFACSIFDEFFQLHLSNRIFDLGDVGKDCWGSSVGIVMLALGVPEARDWLKNWYKIRHPHVRDYVQSVPSVIVFSCAFSFMLLVYGSLLSEQEYWWIVLSATAVTFVVFFALLHFSQRKWLGWSMAAVGALAIVALAISFVYYRDDGFVYHGHNLVVYNGIPVPFFDLLVSTDGLVRPVDKKHFFNMRDNQFFLLRDPDILLIGTGYSGVGGRGFKINYGSVFQYNHFKNKMMQVIIVDTKQACEMFNRLQREGKRVLCVIHTTC